jgi:radical SAM protein with 4Fe4S-binding SPASM domain
MERVSAKALDLSVPLSAHLDLTYRCNQRCIHCYLDHDDQGEMSTSEIRDLLDQMARAGVLFLTVSGGEVFLREDLFPILEHARALLFSVKLKTNGTLIRERHAVRLRALGIGQVQVSIYSHRAEVHDAVTQAPGSLECSLAGIRLLRALGIRVVVANVLMRQNARDHAGVKALASELDAEFTIDPTITPPMNRDPSILALNLPRGELERIFRDETVVGDVGCFTAPPGPLDDSILGGIPCSAGHTLCYVSPYGDIYPCVQFPLSCGNLRLQPFAEIWRHSPQFQEVRSIRVRDLTTCSSCVHVGTCTRCPGLAYLEGNVRGPSTADCEKSFVRTGIEAATMLAKGHGERTGPARAASLDRR